MPLNSHVRSVRIAVLVLLTLTPVQAGFTQELQKHDQVSCSSLANVAVPKYRIGQNVGGKTTSDEFILTVSVKPSDASREKMMALSCKLASVYAAFDDFYLMVFDEHLAAALYSVAVHVPYEEARLKLRATYNRKRTKGTVDFMWFPNGGDWNSAQRFNLTPST